MSKFSQRSASKELLDRQDIPFADIRKNMEELDFINTHLGGHKITLAGLKQYPGLRDAHIMEIGCGGGDNLRVIRQWGLKNKHSFRLTGVDINQECIDYARSNSGNSGIGFVCSDYRDLELREKPDLIFSSLFCHHFTNEELITMLQWLRSNSKLGFFINDLQRHPFAYYSIKLLTRLFSHSYLVKNDAPLSVLRGMKRNEWETVFGAAGIKAFNCEWKWAFRWLITYVHDR